MVSVYHHNCQMQIVIEVSATEPVITSEVVLHTIIPQFQQQPRIRRFELTRRWREKTQDKIQE
jgi:hypothetical protein